MMGRQQTQDELWAPALDLFSRIPADHMLRRIEGVLDLSFVRAEVAGCYGNNGNRSVDPVVLMKMMLLLFLDDVPSERELMRIIPLRLDYLWFLGFGLNEEIPDHSVLSKARRRWGAEIFERLFACTIEQCMAAGLVDGRKLHVDASLVTADASRNSMVRQVVLREVDKLEAAPVPARSRGAMAGGSTRTTAAQPIRKSAWCATVSVASPLRVSRATGRLTTPRE